MHKFLTTAAIVMALTAPAFAQGMSGPAQPSSGMTGPAQTGNTGMSGGMAHNDSMAHNDGMAMGKKKPKKHAMKHDSMSGGAMSGGSMSGPAQTGNAGMSGGMASPNH